MSSIIRCSNAVLGIEKRLLGLLVAALVVLILVNIVTRAAGAAIFWIDELAIYAMIWMALIGASAMLRMRMGVAVTLVTDLLPEGLTRIVGKLVDAVLLALALILLVLCWRWYDPVALARSGFDFDSFALESFNFIYTEPTSTLGIQKFWVWLAVPLAALTLSLHALANLLEAPSAAAPGETGEPVSPVGPGRPLEPGAPRAGRTRVSGGT